jgi:polyhydroxybutyrate depolymerase
MLACSIRLNPLAFLVVAASLVHAAEPEKLTLQVDGVEREALVYAPTVKPKSGGSPLVFVFHGHGGTMKSAARSMRFYETWPEAIVIYPQGLNTPTRVDPEGKRPGWQRSAGDQKDRDLKLFDAMLADIEKKNPVDQHRIYAMGFSNGAVFTYVLWAERPGVLAAVAPIAGLPLDPAQFNPVPKPAFIIAGRKDELVKFANQQAMIEKVREMNGATAKGTSAGQGFTRYTSDSGTPVETLIHPGGHLVPPEAVRLITEFFQENRLKQ